MARRTCVGGVLGRPPLVAVLGALGMLLVVWGAAAPRTGPADSTGRGPADWARVDSESFIFKYGCGWLCLPGPPGTQLTTSDTVGVVLGWVVVAVVSLVALLCLAVCVRALLAVVRSRDDRLPAHDDAADLDLDALADLVSADAAQRLEALSYGTAAQGILAAWMRLEATLSDVGVALPASRTSSEVCVQVLDRFPVPSQTLYALADLYREARWSRHPLTEEDRVRAATAYRVLDADLRAIVTARTSPAPPPVWLG